MAVGVCWHTAGLLVVVFVAGCSALFGDYCPAVEEGPGRTCKVISGGAESWMHCGGACASQAHGATCCEDLYEGAISPAACCPSGQTCCSVVSPSSITTTGCCPAAATCCPSGCAGSGETCCGATRICSAAQQCCGGDVCCEADAEECVSGSCCAREAVCQQQCCSASEICSGDACIPRQENCTAMGADLSALGSAARGNDTVVWAGTDYVVFNPCGGLRYVPVELECSRGDLACWGDDSPVVTGSVACGAAPGLWYVDGQGRLALYAQSVDLDSQVFRTNITFACAAATEITIAQTPQQNVITYQTPLPAVCGFSPPGSAFSANTVVVISAAGGFALLVGLAVGAYKCINRRKAHSGAHSATVNDGPLMS
ncbi:hypothetical protein DIPPA_34140 [Diplonema papillatum]|nr:hypothetical protein DIPPA_34140 [Diplonema papillatum]